MKWRPIKTAPRDGTRMIAWNGEEVRVVNEPKGYSPGTWTRRDGCWYGQGDPRFKATHWMPLPAPPKVRRRR